MQLGVIISCPIDRSLYINMSQNYHDEYTTTSYWFYTYLNIQLHLYTQCNATSCIITMSMQSMQMSYAYM